MIEPAATTLKRKRGDTDTEDGEYAPTATVLLALPMLVSYPPDHPMHVPGLRVSLKALRRCTGLSHHNDGAKRVKGDGWVGQGEGMTPELEVRAWMALVEVGMMVLATRCSRWGEDDQAMWEWTKGVEKDIDTALLKGLALATSLPSLRSYKDPFTLLSARAATPKRAVKILSSMVSSSQKLPPTKYTYEAYLALADLHLRPSPSSGGKLNLGAGLHVLEQMRTRADQAGDEAVARLATVATLRARVVHNTAGNSHEVDELEELLHKTEGAMGITYDLEGTATMTETSNLPDSQLPPTQLQSQYPQTPQPSTPPAATTPSKPSPSIEPGPTYLQHLRAHTLFLGVALYTHLGDAQSAAQRLAKLHAILDGGLLDHPDGSCFCGMSATSHTASSPRKEMPTVDMLGATADPDEPNPCPCSNSFLLPIPLASPTAEQLLIKSTNPRVIFELAFLVSSIARRDVVGRKPRRMVFAVEGLRAGAELGIEVAFPVWATLEDVRETELRLAEIRADLMCELVAIATMRSEFDVAEQRLAEVVAHARNFGLFESFAARIALHHAHLAHARGVEERARMCYEAAIRSSSPGSYIHTSSSAGLLGLQMGIAARDRYIASASPSPSTPPPDTPKADQTLLNACTHSLAPLARILTSPTLPIVKAKQELKLALDLSSKAQDNYLRALGVAMSAAKYMHTAESHAGVMLGTVRALAAGMGAVESKKAGESPSKEARDGGKDGSKKNVGNAVLGLWVGLRLYELHKRAGEVEQSKKQDARNRRLVKAVAAIEAVVQGKVTA